MDKELFDCAVIGAGPGGYVAAIRAAQRGLKTVLVEAENLGGVCLNCGCIPSKALIANAEIVRKIGEANQYGIQVGKATIDYSSMKKRKDAVVEKMRRGIAGLMASNKIRVLKGFGKFLSPHEIKVTGPDETIFMAKNTIIATGSRSRSLESVPFDYKQIHDSTSLLDIQSLPKKLVIIGGGVIGCEFACMHHAFGVDVTIIELLPSLILTEGEKMAEAFTANLRKQGIKIETGSTVQRIEKKNDSVILYLESGKSIEADAILVSIGRTYNSSEIGLDKAGVIVQKNGAIASNENLQTNISHVYAIGDVTGMWLLAHVASHQGLVAADHIAKVGKKMHYRAVPSVIFTYPEVASVGRTLEKARLEGYDAISGKFPFQALGKSQAILETEGFAEVVLDKKTKQILGAQVMGFGASTLIAEMALAIENELTVECITDTIHAHPTLSEGWMEAAFLANGLPLHLPPKILK